MRNVVVSVQNITTQTYTKWQPFFNMVAIIFLQKLLLREENCFEEIIKLVHVICVRLVVCLLFALLVNFLLFMYLLFLIPIYMVKITTLPLL